MWLQVRLRIPLASTIHRPSASPSKLSSWSWTRKTSWSYQRKPRPGTFWCSWLRSRDQRMTRALIKLIKPKRLFKRISRLLIWQKEPILQLHPHRWQSGIKAPRDPWVLNHRLKPCLIATQVLLKSSRTFTIPLRTRLSSPSCQTLWTEPTLESWPETQLSTKLKEVVWLPKPTTGGTTQLWPVMWSEIQWINRRRPRIHC